MLGPYFGEPMLNRQRLLWAVATRRQLERWEPFVAAAVRADLRGGTKLEDADIWLAATEHHFVLIAARHLLHALELPPRPNLQIDPTIRDELIEGRNLHEHWVENMPIFNMTPRPREPKYRLTSAPRLCTSCSTLSRQMSSVETPLSAGSSCRGRRLRGSMNGRMVAYALTGIWYPVWYPTDVIPPA